MGKKKETLKRDEKGRYLPVEKKKKKTCCKGKHCTHCKKPKKIKTPKQIKTEPKVEYKKRVVYENDWKPE